jgi:nucleotide-binding universal stress UspA family protein
MTVAGQRFSIERILFATDFSAMSNNAASYARILARRFSSSVEIAHVIEPASLKSYDEPIFGGTEEERRRLVGDKLEQLREDFAALGIDARTVSREANRASLSLLKIVTEQRIDLIVPGVWSRAACPILTAC